jgi:hypothetical protein
MRQFAQDGQGRRAVLGAGQGDGVADAETHAQMGGPDDLKGARRGREEFAFTLYHKVIGRGR